MAFPKKFVWSYKQIVKNYENVIVNNKVKKITFPWKLKKIEELGVNHSNDHPRHFSIHPNAVLLIILKNIMSFKRPRFFFQFYLKESKNAIN